MFILLIEYLVESVFIVHQNMFKLLSKHSSFRTSQSRALRFEETYRVTPVEDIPTTSKKAVTDSQHLQSSVWADLIRQLEISVFNGKQFSLSGEQKYSG